MTGDKAIDTQKAPLYAKGSLLRSRASSALKRMEQPTAQTTTEEAVYGMEIDQNTPCSYMACATFLKPAMLAPATRS